VYTCRTCADARCLTPCEHDASKRDAATGEIKIVEERCIGCSLCALSCPYGAIDMVNVAEPELASFRRAFKARLEGCSSHFAFSDEKSCSTERERKTRLPDEDRCKSGSAPD
jgi:Fe-S-cluster-containing hydrogenase component 2